MNLDDVPVTRVQTTKTFDEIVQEAMKNNPLVPPKSIMKDVLKETNDDRSSISSFSDGQKIIANERMEGERKNDRTEEDHSRIGSAATTTFPTEIKRTQRLVNESTENDVATVSPKRSFLKKGTGVQRIYTPPKERLATSSSPASASPSPLSSTRKVLLEKQKDQTEMTAWELEEHEMLQEVADFESLQNKIRKGASKSEIERAALDFVRRNERAGAKSADPLSYPFSSKEIQATKAAKAQFTQTINVVVADVSKRVEVEEEERFGSHVKKPTSSAMKQPRASLMMSSPIRGSPIQSSSQQRINELARNPHSPLINRSAIKRDENLRKAFEREKAELDREMKNFKMQVLELKEQKDEFASQIKRDRLALDQRERTISGQSRTEREEIKLLKAEIEKMKEDQKYRDEKSKLTIERLRKQVENITNEAGELKLEKERMLEEMRQMKMSSSKSKSVISSTPTKSLRRNEEKASTQTHVFINASTSPPQEKEQNISNLNNNNIYSDNDNDDDDVYDRNEEESIPAEFMRVPELPSKPVWKDVEDEVSFVSEVVHQDGKITRKYSDGRQITKSFDVDTFRVVNGKTMTIYYHNGDIKNTITDKQKGVHIVQYLYRDAKTWQSSYKMGANNNSFSIFHYLDSREVEIEYQNKIKDVHRENGEIWRIYTDQSQEMIGCK
jgi:hypothetical protein